MSQEQGLIGKFVGGMIHRSVKLRFRNVYWIPPKQELSGPVIWCINHHGWHDGYIMFHAVKKLGLRSLDWIQEFDSFPLFRYVGGMPFPAGDPAGRASTIRKTIRLMKDENRSLILFAEGVLHEPPEILPIGKSLHTLAKKVPNATIVPVALVYRMSLHERPEAYLSFGKSISAHDIASNFELVRDRMQEELNSVKRAMVELDKFEVLVAGTPDVNERMKLPAFKKK